VLERQLIHIEMSDPKQKHTDKKLLVKGIKRLALAIPVLILSTNLIQLAIVNREVLPIYIFLSLGIIAMILTIYLLFNGIRTIMKSIF
jgi:hypothetical protein